MCTYKYSRVNTYMPTVTSAHTCTHIFTPTLLCTPQSPPLSSYRHRPTHTISTQAPLHTHNTWARYHLLIMSMQPGGRLLCDPEKSSQATPVSCGEYMEEPSMYGPASLIVSGVMPDFACLRHCFGIAS